MGRQRFRHRSTKPHERKPVLGLCEWCGERGELIRYAIDIGKPAGSRNAVFLDERCRADAQCGHIHAATLRLIAHEREDAALRGSMGHAAYAREGHGAMRQIR